MSQARKKQFKLMVGKLRENGDTLQLIAGRANMSLDLLKSLLHRKDKNVLDRHLDMVKGIVK